MKTKYPVITVALIALFFIGCGNSVETKSKQSENEVTTENKTVIEQNDDSTDEISLNNESRWLVNEEMKPYVENGRDLVNDYIENDKSNYSKLAENLKNENNQLIQSCTMEGTSHDQLHKWLHPHIELVTELSEANNKKEADEIVLELQQSYQVYDKYFK